MKEIVVVDVEQQTEVAGLENEQDMYLQKKYSLFSSG